MTFEDWYARYPKKVAKKQAEKAWSRLNMFERDQAMSDNLERRFRHTKREFIPHPATYLNGARWEDEVIETQDTRHRSILEDLTDRSWAQ